MSRPDIIVSQISKVIEQKDSSTKELYNRLNVKQQEIEVLLQNVNNKLTINSGINNQNANYQNDRSILNKLQDIEGQFQYLKNSNLEQKILNKMQDVEVEIQNVVGNLQKKNSQKENQNEDMLRKILSELKGLKPLQQQQQQQQQQPQTQKNDRSAELSKEISELKKELSSLNSKLQKKSDEITKLSESLQKIQNDESKTENKKQSMFENNQLVPIELQEVRQQYSNGNYVDVLDFNINNNQQQQQKQFSISVPDDVFGEVLREYFSQTRNLPFRRFDVDQINSNTLKVVYYTMSLLGQNVQKAVLDEQNIKEKTTQLEVQNQHGEFQICSTQTAFAIFVALQFEAPIYITSKVAEQYYQT